MGLRYKAGGILLVIFLILMGLSYILNIVHDPRFYFITSAFALIAIFMIQHFIIKPVERLNLQIQTEEEAFKLSQLALQKEVSARQIAEQQLDEERDNVTQHTYYDYLTALPNHVFFSDILQKTITHAKRHEKICGILLLDIKDFKKINENYDRTVGDTVLKSLSQTLANTLRAEDLLARFSADQFIILLSDMGKAKFASTVAEKILQATKKKLTIDNHDFLLHANIGIAIYPADGTTTELLLQNANKALTDSKNTAEDSYQFYNSDLNNEGKDFIQLEKALKKAVNTKALALYYQPKMNLKKGNIVGVEALLRWLHPELGNISPEKLIALAEETGLTMQVLKWSLYEACNANKAWQNEGYEHLTVAINISPKQFWHPDLVNIISDVLEKTKLQPYYLELEINESTVMDHTEAAMPTLNMLKEIGILLSVDHFGMGYTSISHLKKFPISTLKIDKNYIKGIPHTPNDVAILNAFIGLAHHLGLECLAEGVETAEQVEYLTQKGCDIVQGYFISHPVPPAQLIKQLRKIRDEVLI